MSNHQQDDPVKKEVIIIGACVRSSRDIVSMLTSECDRAGVEIRLKCRISRAQAESAKR